MGVFIITEIRGVIKCSVDCAVVRGNRVELDYYENTLVIEKHNYGA